MEDLRFGLTLTAIGMGLVFSLLGLLWLLLVAIGRVETRPAARAAAPPEPEPEARAGPVVVRGAGAADLDAETLAAIAVAVIAHAATRRRQAAPETRTTRPGSRLFASRWLGAGRAEQTRGFTRRR